MKIIECVPNFSEGRNFTVVKEISRAIESVKGIRILDLFSGETTNRSVITFAGDPGGVTEAAFRGIKQASALIDMRKHQGEHPRLGATDVCPLVPVSGITMEETVLYARELAKRVGNELNIPVYCYEYAAFREERRSLAACRTGGYEALEKRMKKNIHEPDFGPHQWSEEVAKSGITVIGARNFLVAFNINLNTSSREVANTIATEVRESGRAVRKDDLNAGEMVYDNDGKPLRIPGTLKKVRAIGWYIEEYGFAQISMNLTDLSVTSLHETFEEVQEKAGRLGIRVTGSELVGLVPLKTMLDAGKHFLRKKNRPGNIPERAIIQEAIESMGLEQLSPFDPGKKIIEYSLNRSSRTTTQPRSFFP